MTPRLKAETSLGKSSPCGNSRGAACGEDGGQGDLESPEDISLSIRGRWDSKLCCTQLPKREMSSKRTDLPLDVP